MLLIARNSVLIHVVMLVCPYVWDFFVCLFFCLTNISNVC